MSAVVAPLYAFTASRSLQGGDVGEFVTVVYGDGTLHPPGYPLYVILAKIFTSFPHVNPVLALSLFSGACGLATCLVLFYAIRNWGMSNESALICSIAFALSPLQWKYSGVPEVFVLGTLLAAMILWVAGRESRLRGWKRALTAGLFLGLGLCNHHTIIILGPVLLLCLLRSVVELKRLPWLTASLCFVAGLLVGISPYLTLLGPAEGAWTWGGDFGFQEVFRHFVRADYGTTSLGIADQSPGRLENPAAYFVGLAPRFSIFAVAGAVGLVAATRPILRFSRSLWRRKGAVPMERSEAVDAAALWASFFLGSVALLALFNLKPEGLSAAVVERFYLLPDLLFAFFAAIGLESVIKMHRRARYYLRATAAGVLSIFAVANVGGADWSDKLAVEDYVFNSLDSLPAGSVVLGVGDLQLFGFLAASEVYARRVDVHYVDLSLLRHRWYYDRVSEQLPEVRFPFDSDSTKVFEFVASATEHHPVFIAYLPRPERWFNGPDFYTYPLGSLLAVVPAGEPFPDILEVTRRNELLFSQMVFRSPDPEPGSWGAEAFGQYARTWGALIGGFEQLGLEDQIGPLRSHFQRFNIED